MFDKEVVNFNDTLCNRSKGKTSCLVAVTPGTSVLWYFRDNQTDTLIQSQKIRPNRFSLPGIQLSLNWEVVDHQYTNDTTIREVFFALKRKELITLIREVVKKNLEKFPEMPDLQRFLLDKANGTINEYCYKIGSKPQTVHTFDDFFNMVKTR